ncbi:MAG TPA: metallophosphoesterase [Candidatus Xenobia bacterium]|nr:metallophosphoesterase [Candidatus Xenobia bacterium]
MFPVLLASLIFFSILGLLVASQLYWFRQGRRRAHTFPHAWQRWGLGVPLYAWFILLLAMFVLVPIRWVNLHNAPVLLSVFMVLRSPVLMIPISLWLTASLFAFLFIQLVRGGGWLVGRLAMRASGQLEGVSVERRYFLQNATRVAGAIPFVMVGYGFVRSRGFYVVEEVTVPIPNLPVELDRLKLLQLTDVHVSAFMPVEEIRHVVGLARELKADLVFHTGDTLTSRGDPLAEAIAELSQVEGAHGSFGCLGNHEIYAGVTDTATRLFAERGVRLLRNQNVELEINGAKLNLIGVDYQRQPRGLEPESWKPYFLRGIEKLVQPDAVNILLTHNPNPFLRAADLGIQLTLSGHTHGGQVQVEILDNRWSPARFITPFISGLYERNGNHLYVSRGVGTIAMPVRLNAPAEITLLTLRRA